MGAKKKALMKKIKKSSSHLVVSRRNDDKNFLPLEGGPAKKLPEKEEPVKDTATVLYIGRIPHGFYEDEMEGFFEQFGKVKRLRIARNKKTGKSKHYGFIEFESPEVTKIVADCMHNYLMFEHMLQVHIVPPEQVHPKLWKRVNNRYKPPDWTQIERQRHNKDKTIEQHQKLLHGILRRDKNRRRKIEAAGIDYECPEIVGSIKPARKKIKFDYEEE